MWRCFRIICTFELWYRMKSKRENHIMSLEEMKKKDSTTVHDYSMSVTSIINFYWFTATKFRYRKFLLAQKWWNIHHHLCKKEKITKINEIKFNSLVQLLMRKIVFKLTIANRLVRCFAINKSKNSWVISKIIKKNGLYSLFLSFFCGFFSRFFCLFLLWMNHSIFSMTAPKINVWIA